MKEGYVDINVVMDTSLSMCKIQKETEEGFNAWLQSQKEAEGDATISLMEFNDFYHPIYEGTNIKKVPEFSLKPRGNTALYDAIGKCIKATGYRLSSMKEEDRPSKVLIVILTDGEENCSRLYLLRDIQEMIQHQKEKYSWEFVFLGANMDAIEAGGRLGIGQECSLTYAATAGGVKSMYASLACSTTSFRDGGLVGKGFFRAEDRQAQSVDT